MSCEPKLVSLVIRRIIKLDLPYLGMPAPCESFSINSPSMRYSIQEITDQKRRKWSLWDLWKILNAFKMNSNNFKNLTNVKQAANIMNSFNDKLYFCFFKKSLKLFNTSSFWQLIGFCSTYCSPLLFCFLVDCHLYGSACFLNAFTHPHTHTLENKIFAGNLMQIFYWLNLLVHC